jgi:hypothetical protein
MDRLIGVVAVVTLVLTGCDGNATKVDGQRVFVIQNSECHGDCPAPWANVRIDGRYYSGSCAPVSADRRSGRLYAVSRGADLQHDWIEARAIPGFDPEIVLAAKRSTHYCKGAQWFVAHALHTPSSADEARRFARPLCEAGTVPVYRSWRETCAAGGPFFWWHDSKHSGNVWLTPTTPSTT